MIARVSTAQALAGIGLMLACVLTATAQPAGQQSSTSMQGFSMNRDQPVRIESNSLEVRDKIRQATFSGDVKLTQGDTTLKCKTLVVFYEDTAGPSKKATTPAPQGAPPQAQKNSSQQIKRAEAKGDVFVVQKDQTASGENGVFDLKSNTVTMTGNVVVTQGQTVMRGEKMVVDLTTGITNVTSKGRVEFLTNPGASKDAKASPAPAPPPAATKAAPKGPIRIN
jgi:lipopolysaccharide export system protein LptA